jgi:MYXO-CTERM domain-containing protein
MCIDTYCIPQRCVGVSCPAGQRCDNETGSCVDLCDKVVCSAPSYCKRGLCVNCNTVGEECQAGQMCVGGVCQTDPCQGVTCGNGQYCANGACVELCTHIDCAKDQRCVAGRCIADPCAQTACQADEYCDIATGACKKDTCQAQTCPLGQRCISGKGKCEADPCAFVQCPEPCFACDVTSAGEATCKFLNDDQHPQCQLVRITTGQKGGGCTCALSEGGGDPLSGLALAVGMLGLVLSRRRRSPVR